MRAKSFLLAMTLTLVACGGSGGGSGSSNEVSTQASTGKNPSDSLSANIPRAAFTFDTNLALINMTAAQMAKFDRAVEIVKLVVATEEFRNRILGHTFNGVQTFVDNNGLSNGEVYQLILDGAEKLRPTVNNAMDMDVELYTADNTVVGYTYPNINKIWVNTKYFDKYTAAGVAHNLMHEWLHKIGFGHDATSTPERPYSVPYAVGYIVAEIGKDFL